MIEEIDPDFLGGFLERLGELPVGLRRLHLSRRVVMNDDHRCRPVDERNAKCVRDGDRSPVSRPTRDLGDPADLELRVEEDGQKHLLVLLLEIGAHEFENGR